MKCILKIIPILVVVIYQKYAIASNYYVANTKRYSSAKNKASVRHQNTPSQDFFDFSYSGNVKSLLFFLRQYNPRLIILQPLGTVKDIQINISLQAATLQDINDAVMSQTNNQVGLLYSEYDNTVRLNYTGALDVGANALAESLKWQHGENPRPVLQKDGVVRFPYGEYQPVIVCQPLNLCDIELQAGEKIQGILIGDSLRWNEGDQSVPIVYSGIGADLVPHLVLKPSQGGLDTALIVTTSKRTYMFKLKSSYNGYIARAGFYYPKEIMQDNDSYNKDQLHNKLNSQDSQVNNPPVGFPLINLSKISYTYSINGDNYAWKPVQVFDDGTSVYIQMPDKISSQNLPGICVLVDGDNNKCEMVNFRYNNHFYVIDRLFNRAKLVNGYDDDAQIITIVHNPEKPGFWARIFGA